MEAPVLRGRRVRVGPEAGEQALERFRAEARAGPRPAPPGWPSALTLRPQGLAHERLLLGHVHLERAGRGRGRGGAAGVAREPGPPRRHVAVQEPLAHEAPRRPCCAAPPGTRRSRPTAGSARGAARARRPGTGRAARRARAPRRRAPRVLAGLQQVVVDLARAEHHAAHARRVGAARRRSPARSGPRPAPASDETQRGWRSRLLGVKTTSGFSTGSRPCQAQQVEVRGGRRGIGHAHVVLGAEGQEALDARARVLGPLALVAVRQQQHEAARLAPLRLASRRGTGR